MRATALTHATQTNEAARCALHVPALAGIEGPLALLEVGASAGLCLYPDRYSYRYTGHPQLDPVDGPSPVVLDCAVDGPVPVPERLPEVVWRGGIDLNPLDVRRPTTSRGSTRWSGPSTTIAVRDCAPPPRSPRRPAAHRRGRPQRAAARRSPPRRPADATLVVFHTAVLMYLDEPGRARFAEQVRELPGHWLSVEGRAVTPGIRVRDDVPNDSSDLVLALDGVQLAWAQPHGRAIRWVPNP